MAMPLKHKCIRCGAPCRKKYCAYHASVVRMEDAYRHNALKNKKNRLKANECGEKSWNVMARMIGRTTGRTSDRDVPGESNRYTVII